MANAEAEKLLGLLGLARRAGKLAVGMSAVEKMVRRGENPVVVTARDMGASQRSKVDRWKPLRGVVDDVLTAEEMAGALGRDKLAVVAVAEPGFAKGILKLVGGRNGNPAAAVEPPPEPGHDAGGGV